MTWNSLLCWIKWWLGTVYCVELSDDLETEKELSNDLETKKELSNDLETKKELSDDLETKKELSGDLETNKRNFVSVLEEGLLQHSV